MRISYWSSGVCSSDLIGQLGLQRRLRAVQEAFAHLAQLARMRGRAVFQDAFARLEAQIQAAELGITLFQFIDHAQRSEEHTSELQSLMRISYAVFCLKTQKKKKQKNNIIKIIR